jgi:GNAT superfamily N-acetyltransferase
MVPTRPAERAIWHLLAGRSAQQTAVMQLDLTYRGAYGIRAILHLVRMEGALVTSASIAAAMAIPPRFLPRVMGYLVRAPILEGPWPTVLVRSIEPADRTDLERFYAALSSESRRRRFLGTSSGLPDGSCRLLCSPDHEHEEGFVAVRRSAGPDDGEIVGHLCLVPVDATTVELAVAVADEHQGRGIGRHLLEAALAWAKLHHIATVAATAFADNAAVLRLLTSAPRGASVRPVGAGVVEIEMPLELPRRSAD